MLKNLFNKAFNSISDTVFLAYEINELTTNRCLLPPWEYRKTFIDNKRVIIIGSTIGNIFICNSNGYITYKNIKYISNLKEPALNRILFVKLKAIIEDKKKKDA